MQESLDLVYGPELWSLQNEGGISRYFQNLIQGISTLGLKGTILVNSNQNLRLASLQNSNFDIRDTQKLRNYHQSPRFESLFSNRSTVLHPTYYSASHKDLKSFSGAIVITVFDMISEIFPERRPILSRRENSKQISIEVADHIICISNRTKMDLMKYYNVSEQKISVTYLGSEMGEFSSSLTKSSPDFPYLLFVGKRSGYKNFSKFLSAFSTSRELKDSFRVVCVGGGDFTTGELKFMRDLGISKNVFHVSANDSQLASLYIGAKSLIYPSLYEGFGLPPLEAMSVGCPVIASSAGSIPEICGSAAAYFDPLSIDSIQDVMISVLKDDSRMSSMVQLGKLNSTKFSWENTAIQTLEIYRQF